MRGHGPLREFLDYVDLRTLKASPKRPAAGWTRLFGKRADGDLYQLEADGTETSLAVVGGGGGRAFSGCVAYHNTTQNGGSGIYAAAALNSEDLDTDAYHSTVTNTSRLTVPTTDYYLVQATGGLCNTATNVYASVRLNGTTSIRGTQVSPAGSGPNGTHLVAILSLTAADYIELMFFNGVWGHASDPLNQTRLGIMRLN